MKVCTFFHILLICRLYIVSPFLTPLFHKTTVNVQPLSPPVFNKIVTHSKNLRFFILFVFGFACFQLVVIFVDFQTPFGTQLVQNGMKMVPKTDPLGCFLYNFDPRCQKRAQPTTPRTFSFVTLAPKPDFHLHCDQPQHETHNPQHILSEWIWCCLGIPFLDRCLRMFFLYSTQGSDKICQDLQRSAKICQDQTRSTKGSASTNLQAPLAETNHETPSSKNEGAAVSRRMASSIKKVSWRRAHH
jgi:hypothetical protein